MITIDSRIKLKLLHSENMLMEHCTQVDTTAFIVNNLVTEIVLPP